MSEAIDGTRALAEGRARAAKRDYPKSCASRGDVIGMVEDSDLPPGIRLKQWACEYWKKGVTWKDCGALSKLHQCHKTSDML